MSRLSRAGGSRKVPVRYAAPREPSPLLQDAIRAHKKGQYQTAYEQYQERLKQAPACLDAAMNLAALQAQLGLAQETKENLERAARLAPNNARVHRDAGLGYWTVGAWERAVAAFERSVQLDPALVGSWLHLARTRLEVTDRAAAVAAAERAVELRPKDPSARFLLARCLFNDRAIEAALAALEQARHLESSGAEVALFHWLLQSLGSGRVDAEQERRLREAHPMQTHMLDAMVFITEELPNCRVFSSVRETLQFALQQSSATGNVVELGVFHGVSLRWLAEWRQEHVHGFDSFLGLPDEWDPVPQGRFTTAGRTPQGINATYWIGLFEEQLPKYLEAEPDQVALLHVDSDLYSSARAGLSTLAPVLGPGTLIAFDEFLGHRSWQQDEYLAFQQTAAEHGWNYEYLAVNPFSGQVVLRLVG